jgi:hypothetical protein
VARVVDEDVQAAELLDGGPDEPLDGVVVADVRRRADGRPARLADLLCDRLGALLRPRVRDHVRPLLGEPLGDGLPDAAARSRDDGRPSVHVSHDG